MTRFKRTSFLLASYLSLAIFQPAAFSEEVSEIKHEETPFEIALNDFVEMDACKSDPIQSVYIARAQEIARSAARKLDVETLAGRIVRLPFEEYMTVMHGLAARYTANSRCWDGLMDLFDEIQDRLPEPNPLTREERYKLQREETIAKWAGMVFLTTTVIRSFSGAPKDQMTTPKNIALGIRGGVGRISTIWRDGVARMAILARNLKNAPALETEAEAAARQLGPNAFEKLVWKGSLCLEDLRFVLDLVWRGVKSGAKSGWNGVTGSWNAITSTYWRFMEREKHYVEKPDRLAQSFDPIERLLIPEPGQSQWGAAKAFYRNQIPGTMRFLGEVAASTLTSAIAYSAYRGLGYGDIAPERPRPKDLIAFFQASLIMDLERRLMALEEAIAEIETKQMTRENIAQVDKLRKAYDQMQDEWMHFRDRAPRFNHTVVLNTDEAVNLEDSYELMGRLGSRLSLLPTLKRE